MDGERGPQRPVRPERRLPAGWEGRPRGDARGGDAVTGAEGGRRLRAAEQLHRSARSGKPSDEAGREPREPGLDDRLSPGLRDRQDADRRQAGGRPRPRDHDRRGELGRPEPGRPWLARTVEDLHRRPRCELHGGRAVHAVPVHAGEPGEAASSGSPATRSRRSTRTTRRSRRTSRRSSTTAWRCLCARSHGSRSGCYTSIKENKQGPNKFWVIEAQAPGNGLWGW